MIHEFSIVQREHGDGLLVQTQYPVKVASEPSCSEADVAGLYHTVAQQVRDTCGRVVCNPEVELYTTPIEEQHAVAVLGGTVACAQAICPMRRDDGGAGDREPLVPYSPQPSTAVSIRPTSVLC